MRDHERNCTIIGFFSALLFKLLYQAAQQETGESVRLLVIINIVIMMSQHNNMKHYRRKPGEIFVSDMAK